VGVPASLPLLTCGLLLPSPAAYTLCSTARGGCSDPPSAAGAWNAAAQSPHPCSSSGTCSMRPPAGACKLSRSLDLRVVVVAGITRLGKALSRSSACARVCVHACMRACCSAQCLRACAQAHLPDAPAAVTQAYDHLLCRGRGLCSRACAPCVHACLHACVHALLPD